MDELNQNLENEGEQTPQESADFIPQEQQEVVDRYNAWRANKIKEEKERERN